MGLRRFGWLPSLIVTAADAGRSPGGGYGCVPVKVLHQSRQSRNARAPARPSAMTSPIGPLMKQVSLPLAKGELEGVSLPLAKQGKLEGVSLPLAKGELEGVSLPLPSKGSWRGFLSPLPRGSWRGFLSP